MLFVLPCVILASCCAVLSFFGVIILMALGWGFQAEVEVRLDLGRQ